jgi:tetratricopeptide (TPR) repeat protein
MAGAWLTIDEAMSSSSSAATPKRLETPGVQISSKLFQSSLFRSSLFQSSLFQSPRQRNLLLCLVLTIAVLAVYNPVTHNRFIRYDDDEYITSNPEVRAGLTWNTVKWAFTTYEQANWHPLTWLSHALDCQLFGLNPAGPHYVNVLLHASNVVLLFLLLQSATGCRWRSLMVAALFALHPINVESVAWAAERKNVLSMLFFLLALYAYGWYARRPGVGRYASVAFLFVLSLLCKPQAITFPFLLLLWDYWPLRRRGAADVAAQAGNERRWSSGGLVLEKLPLLALSAASAVITMRAQKAGGAVKAFSEYSLPLRLEATVISYVRYLGKAFWPDKLVALYPHATALYPAWQVGAALVLLVLITVWVLRARDQRYLAVGWFWFLGSLVPMIGLVQVGLQAMADRYAYIPFVGLFLMLTWLAGDWVWLAGDWVTRHEISAKWLAVPAVSCLAVLGTATYRQVGYWHDTESFWLRTLALTEDNYVAQVNLGEFLYSEHRTDEAAAHFRAALAIHPDSPAANLNLAAYEDRRGNLAAAIEHYQAVVNHGGDVSIRATAYDSLGFVYRQMGQPLNAKQCFETALQVGPGRARARIGLGLIAQDDGDLGEAIREYSLALAAQPSEVAELLLAQALQKAGHSDEGRAIFQRLQRSSPNLPEAEKEAESLLAGK